MRSDIEIRVLGPLSVRVDGRSCSLGGRKQQSLFALLALRSPAPVSTDACVEALWGDEASETSHHTLHTYVSNLRKVLRDLPGVELERTANGYRLDLGDGVLDRSRFEALVREAEASPDPSVRAERLAAALALWRGEALGEFGSEPWARSAVAELTEKKQAALVSRIDADLERGRHREVVGELERLVAEQPFREELWARLMLALYRSGRQADALSAFQRARRLLGEELGIDPGPELADLEERMLRQDPALGAPAAQRATPSASFPAPRGDLIGRDELLEQIDNMMRTERLVTLVGPGGVGKTSLAISAAASATEQFEDMWFCDLVPVTDDGVADSVAGTLGLTIGERASSRERIAHWIGARRTALVLDNCEHVLDGTADLVANLVDSCPGLVVLATSREALGLAGERLVVIPPLASDPAVELLRRRAAIEMARTDKLVELCERLDHLPLAIELAAVRLSHLSVDEILERVDQRLRLLGGVRRDHPRHAALEATIDWSYRLLTESEQSMLRSAAVFVGGFDLSAAAAVWGGEEFDALELIGSLVAKSLVVAETRDSSTRYRLLETVRAFAADRLDDADEREERTRAHAEFYLARALATPPRPPDVNPWRPLFEARGRPADLSNQLSSVHWLEMHDRLPDAARILSRIFVIEEQPQLEFGRHLLEREDIAAALDELTERALYLVASALHATMLGHWETTLRCSRQVIELDVDPHLTAIAAGLGGQVANWLAPDLVDSMLEAGKRALPVESRALRLFLLERECDTLFFRGRTQDAVERLVELRTEGDVWAAYELCAGYHLVGRDDLVEDHIAGMSDAELEAPFRYRIDLARALAAVAEGELQTAAAHLARAAGEAQRHPGELYDHDVLIGLAALALAQGEAGRASRLLATVQATTRTPASFILYLMYRDRVRAELSADEIDRIRDTMTGRTAAEVLETELDRPSRGDP